MEVSFTILGQPQSKANSRIGIISRGRPRFIKSKAALAYNQSAVKQVSDWINANKVEGLPFTEDVRFDAVIYYKTRKPDLDASLILDSLQNLIYVNDRQVKEIHLYHRLDKENPRAVIRVRTLNEKDWTELLP